jgi:hypothetical protein
MKKHFNHLISLFVIIIIGQSCEVDRPYFSALLLSLTKSALPGTSVSYHDPVGAQVGFVLPVFSFNEEIGINAEANISMQGAKYEEDNGLKGKVSLLYVNIPFVVRYQTQSGFFGEAGLQPGFLLSAKDKYEGHIDDYGYQFKKIDFALPLGIGYEFKNNFGIGFRLTPGITNINAEGTDKDRNMVVALRGTYRFKLR